MFHQLSRALINFCIRNNIGTIVIGYNENWKQRANMGRRNNQNFVNIPFYTLVQKITYKAKLVSIKVVRIEESHTSKCSFLDNEPIQHHDQYVGRRGVYRNGRICRGLFKTKDGRIINSDINGAYNILRKAFPNALPVDGIEGLGLVPYSVKFTELNKLGNLNPTTNALPKVAKTDGTEVRGLADEMMARGPAGQPATSPVSETSKFIK